MILSKQHNTIVFSPPKTGTRYRMIRFKDVNDMKRSPGNMHVPVSYIHEICNDFELDQQTLHKVVCIRNPWRRYASLFDMMWRARQNKDDQSQLFIKWINSEHFNRRAFSLDTFLFDKKGDLGVDEILQVDDWNAHIDRLKQLLHDDSDVSHDYKSKYSYEDTYKQWYTQQAIDRVAEKDAKTIELLNLTF